MYSIPNKLKPTTDEASVKLTLKFSIVGFKLISST